MSYQWLGTRFAFHYEHANYWDKPLDPSCARTASASCSPAWVLFVLSLLCKSFGQMDLLEKAPARLPYNSQKQSLKERAVTCYNQMLFRMISQKNVMCFFPSLLKARLIAEICTLKCYVTQWNVHLFHTASFTYRPDLLPTKVIGKASITCRSMSMENWRMAAVLNRFEKTHKYAYLYKGKLVSLLLHVLWSTDSSPATAWDTDAAEIMSNCEIAWVQLLVYIDFVQTAVHNCSWESQAQLETCTVSAKDVSTGFWEATIFSLYSLHVFSDLALIKPLHFWVQAIHRARICTRSLIWREVVLKLGQH